MKRGLIFTTQQGFSQDLPINEKTGKVSFENIVKVDGVSKIDLYLLANEWFAKTFNSGNSVIQMQDKEEGEKWMKLSAEQGNADAQFTLGLMHLGELGETEDYPGETEDHKEAEKWIKLSAEQKNADAQCLLGDMYLEGMGVTEDYAEAIKWWKLAAEQGHERAKYNLDNYK